MKGAPYTMPVRRLDDVKAAKELDVVLAQRPAATAARPDARHAGHRAAGSAPDLARVRMVDAGPAAAWLYEASFRLEVYLFVILGPLGLWLGQTGDRAGVLLVGSGLLVLSRRVAEFRDRGGRSTRYGAGAPRTRRPRQGHGLGGRVLLMFNVVLSLGADPRAALPVTALGAAR